MDIAFETLRSLPFGAAERRRAALALATGAAAGAATQALFWRTGVGLNFWLWDVMMAGATTLLARRGPLAPAAWGAIATCVALGFAVVRFESDWALAIAAPSTMAALALLPSIVRDAPSLTELASAPARALASLVNTPRAAREVARLPGVAAGGEGGGVLRGVLRGVAVGLPTAGVFTALLASDSDFAAALDRVRAQVGDAALFATWSAVTAAGYLFAHALNRREPARARDVEVVDLPYREGVSPEDHAPPAARVSVVTWAVVVSQVALVFALFVAANLRQLFGGAALVRAPGTLTYAKYLHAGFAQLLFATVLSVCLVLAGHALLRPRGQAMGEAVPGGRLLASLEGALLVLTGVTVASCWQRLRIYEDAYGASQLRLGVAVIELSVLGVLALTMVKVIARRWSGHGGAMLALAAVVAVGASAFDADAYVARVNLDRAEAGHDLDVDYLLSLSGDASGALDHPYVASHPALGRALTAAFCRPHDEGLRARRGLALGRCAEGAR